MSAAEIEERAAALDVSLWIEGERISMAGPSRAVATIKPQIAAHKPEIIAYLRAAANDAAGCAGALIDPDGGAYLPWGPYLSPADVQRMRGELFDMIDALAQAEAWTPERYADPMDRAANGPLADLLPNVEYFNAKLIERRAEAEATALLAARSWRYEGR